MYNTSLRIVNNNADAEDIMQEAFLSAFSKIESYKGDVSFGSWMKRIVVNMSLDYLRKKKKQQFIFETENIVPEERNDDYFIQEEEDTSLIQKIKEEIAHLADGYRIIITLNLIEGYDHDEISEILKITASTSRSQLARAKRKLIELLNCKSHEQKSYERA